MRRSARQEWPSLGRPLDDVRVYWPQTKPMMQSLLGILADIDAAYDEQVQNLMQAQDLDPGARTDFLRKLDQAHRETREPYSRQVALLQAAVWPIQAWRDQRSQIARAEADDTSREPSTPQHEDHHPARMRRRA